MWVEIIGERDRDENRHFEHNRKSRQVIDLVANNCQHVKQTIAFEWKV